jgi:hypothetical protein
MTLMNLCAVKQQYSQSINHSAWPLLPLRTYIDVFVPLFEVQGIVVRVWTAESFR